MRAAPAGAMAGATAGAGTALFEVVLRMLAGIPTPSELIADRTLPMLPVDTFLRLLGLLGGPIVAKELAYWGGFAGLVAAGAAAGVVWSRLSARSRGGRIAGTALAVMTVALAALLWPVLASNYLGLPPGLATGVNAVGLALTTVLAAALLRAFSIRPVAPPQDAGRREVLVAGVGLAMLAVTGGLATRLFQLGAFSYDGMRLLVHGARRPITPVADFYSVTKNLVDPYVDAGLWRLDVTGAVDAPLVLTLEELMALETTMQETTLECISNGVAYGLLSNGLWAGVPLAALIARAKPHPSARFVILEGADGYTYSLPMQRVTNGQILVAHSLNGEPLTQRHGAPARAVVPGMYGEASAKWLNRITLLDHDEPGYYARQGWRAEFVHTTSVIDIPAHGQLVNAGAAMAVRGVAFAGDRGISRVEFSPDGGGSWLPARIDYARSPLAWALWSADWTPATKGAATLTVRAYDGAGERQEAMRHGTVPAGASGLHQVVVTVA